MASPAELKKHAKILILCKELEQLTGWRTASIYAKDKDPLPCGILIGDEEFFELLNEDGE